MTRHEWFLLQLQLIMIEEWLRPSFKAFIVSCKTIYPCSRDLTRGSLAWLLINHIFGYCISLGMWKELGAILIDVYHNFEVLVGLLDPTVYPTKAEKTPILGTRPFLYCRRFLFPLLVNSLFVSSTPCVLYSLRVPLRVCFTPLCALPFGCPTKGVGQG